MTQDEEEVDERRQQERARQRKLCVRTHILLQLIDGSQVLQQVACASITE